MIYIKNLDDNINQNEDFFLELVHAINFFRVEDKRYELAALYVSSILRLSDHELNEENIGKLLIHLIKLGADFYYTPALRNAIAQAKRIEANEEK